MRQVWPAIAEVGESEAGGAEVDEGALRRLYAMPAALDRPYVRTNFVASLDGSAQGPDGRSGTINTATDQRLFALQRALCDAVLVGAGTARAEGYRAVELTPGQRAVRAEAGLGGVPPLLVVTRSLRLDPAMAAPRGAGAVIVLTGSGGSDRPFTDAGIEVLHSPGPAGVDLRTALDHLNDRGLRRILCEGGPTLHRQLVADGLVDEVCLTVVGEMVGGAGRRITAGPALHARFDPAHLLLDDDGTLFGRWRRRDE